MFRQEINPLHGLQGAAVNKQEDTTRKSQHAIKLFHPAGDILELALSTALGAAAGQQIALVRASIYSRIAGKKRQLQVH